MILSMKFLILQKAKSFFDPVHKRIYEIIEQLNSKGMIANPITLKNFLKVKKT